MDKSQSRRSPELRPVPENSKLSNLRPKSSATNTPWAAHSLFRGGTAGEDGGREVGGSGDSGPLGTVSTSRSGRLQTSRQTGGLGRTSIVDRLRGGLADIGKLQAIWLNNALDNKSAEQDYVNEEDQGFVALVARHVDVSAKAWNQCQLGTGGTWWGTAHDPFQRSSVRPGIQERNDNERTENEGEAAEEGRAKEDAAPKPRASIFGLPVIQPYNLFAVLWSMTMLFLDLTYTAFWVPMNVAFCTANYGKLSSGCTSSDLVGGIFYFMNTLLGFQIGLVATSGFRKCTVIDGRTVAWLYIRSSRFWLDVLASLPLVYLIVVLALRSYTHLDKAWVNCLSLLRLLRMLRLVSISKVVYFDSLSGRFQNGRLGRVLSVTVVYSAFLAYQLAVAINLFACIMVLCAYFEGYENSWMTAVDWVNVPKSSPVYQWYCAVYWMIVTGTTTGFGDFQPRSLAEQVVANVVMMGGMIMFGVLVAAVGNALSRATADAHQAYASRKKIMHVMEWTAHRGLPEGLRKQVQNFYADKYGRKEENALDAAVMLELPSRLRAKVARYLCTPLMAEVHIMMDLPDGVVTLLSENMRPMRLPAGEDLCQQGDVASCFWILQEGTVQAVRYREGSVTIDASSGPQLIGESVLLGEAVEACRVRPWTLRTQTPCRLWGISLGELYPLMRLYPVIGVVAAEYVKVKTLALYYKTRGDDYWCELAAAIVKQLQVFSEDKAAEEQARRLVAALAQASAFDGTLQPVLEQVLAFCAARRGARAPDTPFWQQSSCQLPRGASEALRDTAGVPAQEHQGLSHPQAPGQLQPNRLGGGPAPPLPHTGGGSGGGGSGGGGANTAFGTPAAVAALTAALQAVPSGGLDAAAATAAAAQMGAGVDGALPYGAGSTATGAATSGAAVQCPGCQRCICPSCGQGLDAAAPPAANPAAAAALLQFGVSTKPNAVPDVRSWMSRGGTMLRRVSIGARQDQVWASERRSFDRRQLGAVSIAPFNE